MYKEHRAAMASRQPSARSMNRNVEVSSDAPTNPAAVKIGKAMQTTSDSLIQTLSQYKNAIEQLKQNGKSISENQVTSDTFVIVENAYENINEIQALLDKGRTQLSQLRFTMDENMDTLKNSVRGQADKKLKIVFKKDIDISLATDTAAANHVYGICLTDQGQIILTDYWNKCLKIVHTNDQDLVKSCLSIDGYPWGLCNMEKNKFALTLTDKKQVCIVNIDIGANSATIEKRFSVGASCRGIAYNENSFFIVCNGHNKEGQDYLKQVSTAGKELRKIEKTGSGVSFGRLKQVHVNGSTLYITDTDNIKVVNSLSNYSLDQFKIDGLDGPYGICEIQDGGIIVTNVTNGKIGYYSTLTKRSEIVWDKEMLKYSVSLAYNKVTKQMAVGMDRSKYIKVFTC